jgi:hypothetical protein
MWTQDIMEDVGHSFFKCGRQLSSKRLVDIVAHAQRYTARACLLLGMETYIRDLPGSKLGWIVVFVTGHFRSLLIPPGECSDSNSITPRPNSSIVLNFDVILF